MCVLPRLRCYPCRGRGASCAWGGGPLGERAGEWRDPWKEQNLCYWKTGSRWPCAWVLYHVPSFSGTQGFAPACYPLHGATVSTAFVTCCVVVAGPKVFYSVSHCAHQNLKLFKNLNIFRASSGFCFNQLEEL